MTDTTSTNGHSNFPVIAFGEIGESRVQTADARDLHAFLQVGTSFRDWIARRIQEYGFIEGTDFCSFLSESQGGRPSKEYAITLDMAKELSMVERNEQGKRARQYFIECERQAHQPRVAANQNLTLVGKEARLQYRMGLEIAKLIGLTGNQAVLSANGLARRTTGIDVLEAMGQTRLIAPQQEHLLTPTDIGRELGGKSALAVNSLLAEHDFQVGKRDHKQRMFWEPTEKGVEAGAVMVDVERSNKSGNSRQLRWASRIVDRLRAVLAA